MLQAAGVTTTYLSPSITAAVTIMVAVQLVVVVGTVVLVALELLLFLSIPHTFLKLAVAVAAIFQVRTLFQWDSPVLLAVAWVLVWVWAWAWVVWVLIVTAWTPRPTC